MAEETPFSIQEHQLNHLQDDVAEEFFVKLIKSVFDHEKPSSQTLSSDAGVDLR
jgi:hypothetical protein